MSDEVKPALSGDEWATRQYRREFTDAHGWGELVEIFARTEREGDRLEISTVDGGGGTILLDDLHPLMALANAALPEGDPRKITRADVEAVRLAADEASSMHDGVLYALAAILPPDPEP